MGFQDRDYVKEKHKQLRKNEKQQLQTMFDKAEKVYLRNKLTYIGGIILLIALCIKEFL